jgi:hypothetical protein
MSFTVKGRCRHGELTHRRKTPEAALKKARELGRAGCYDVHIVTPEGRDYASSEFGESSSFARREAGHSQKQNSLVSWTQFFERDGPTSQAAIEAMPQWAASGHKPRSLGMTAPHSVQLVELVSIPRRLLGRLTNS